MRNSFPELMARPKRLSARERDCPQLDRGAHLSRPKFRQINEEPLVAGVQ
jgi:hypothetical protein